MYRRYVKRIIDILLCVFALPLVLIITLVLSLFIKIDDGGPVFYNANRLGYKGKGFRMYKLRTMKVNSSDIRNSDGSTYNSDNDPRLTRIGRMLRKTSLDEIPQLLNVIKGDMSIVGPRPDLIEQYELYDEEEKKKLDVLPGITGYSQAYYRNSISWRERIQNDIFYVENISFVLDVKIFFKTISTVVSKKGIYQGETK